MSSLLPKGRSSYQCRVVIRQVAAPDYRKGLFEAIARRCASLTVVAGDEYFSDSVKTMSAGPAWLLKRPNWFPLGRRFAWIPPTSDLFSQCDVFIHEWNPRIVSFWRDWLVCRLNGIPVILWGHAWGRRGPAGFAFMVRHWMARRADGVICYTETQARLTRSLCDRTVVVAAPNACLSREDCVLKGVEENRDAVIYVGRIVREKKVGLLVEAFAKACGSTASFSARLILVGDGPERDALARRAGELGIGNRVHWLGHQAAAEVLSGVYAQSFVSVSPGYVGLSLTQSFAFGVPALIARDEPHSPEIEAAQEGINARFFESDNPDDLAARLVGAWEEWRGIASQRETLSAWTRDNYSFETMADRFIEICTAVHKKDRAS